MHICLPVLLALASLNLRFLLRRPFFALTSRTGCLAEGAANADELPITAFRTSLRWLLTVHRSRLTRFVSYKHSSAKAGSKEQRKYLSSLMLKR